MNGKNGKGENQSKGERGNGGGVAGLEIVRQKRGAEEKGERRRVMYSK